MDSNIPLPELQEISGHSSTISFKLTTTSSISIASISWLHHWHTPNGPIGISVGKTGQDYWLLFPQICLFQITPPERRITCHPLSDSLDDTIRHLLLDQVIPRLLSHQGRQVLHASCVQVGKSAIAFSGQSGWGKSTIGAFFHSQGYPLLTDDCLLLQPKGSEIIAIPNYPGLRLFQDSLSLLPKEKQAAHVSHYSKKKRIILDTMNYERPLPINSIFILKSPKLSPTTKHISISKINGATAAMELVKNCFPLDIKDIRRMGNQLQNLALIAGSTDLSIYSLGYSRSTELLPEILTSVLGLLQDNVL